MSKIIHGVWYLCNHSHGYYSKGFWYYCPMDGYLNGNDNNPHRIYAFHRRYFNDGEIYNFVV